jgi:anti-sigma B factor antagonist
VETASEKVGDVTVLIPQGRQVDASNNKAFGRTITTLVAAGDKVILDLGRVEYIDSGGCGAIVILGRQLRSGGGDLKLCSLNPPVRMVLELVRIHHLLDVFNTREEALRAYRI